MTEGTQRDEGGRDSELKGGRECVQRIGLCVDVLMYNYAESERNICVIIFVTLSPLLLLDLVKHLELLRTGV